MESLIRCYLKRILPAFTHRSGAADYDPLSARGENPPYLDEESADTGNENELEFGEGCWQPESKSMYVFDCIPCSMPATEERFSCTYKLLDSAAEETLLHLAVRQADCDTFRLLVEELRPKNYFRDIINRKDYSGDTVLHLATSRKQLQTLELLLEDSSMVEVNAKNKGGFTALDILDVLPDEEEVVMEIRKILGRAGAMRSRDIVEKKMDNKNHEARAELLTTRYHGLLITATLIATMTFHAALRSPALSNESTNAEKQDSEINHLFILFNSIAFFTSVALITLLTYELPLKPWLLIVVSSTIGAYMCTIMAISPHEVVAVLYIGSLVSLAAFFKCLGLDNIMADYMQWMCTRIRVI